MVATAPKIDFDLQPVATDAMMKAGISEDVIKAMAARENGGTVRISAEKTGGARSGVNSASASVTTPSITEIGVYYEQSGGWVEMMPEVVNWRTGGVLKSVGTAFIVKGDVNGRVRGGNSALRLSRPIRLLVYCPEGTQVTEYQLLRLHRHSDAREFRTVTGGIFHVSGDSNRDSLPFSSTKIAARTWTISLDELEPGQYGLLPPGIESRSALRAAERQAIAVRVA
jgi:hypothetical protein